MPKPFNKQLNTDIIKLKELYVATGTGPEYKEMFAAIMEQHQISRTTMYKELAKDKPGSYETPGKPAGELPVSSEEIVIVKELLFKRLNNRTIAKTMSLELGFTYSTSRLKKVKAFIKQGLNAKGEIPGDRPTYTHSLLTRNIFHRLSGYDLSDLNRIQKVPVGEGYHLVSTRVIRDCLEHIAASAAAGGKDLARTKRFDMETILLGEMRAVKFGRYISASGLKQLESIRRSLDNDTGGNSAGSASDHFNDVYRTVKHFAPNVLRRDIQRVYKEVTASSAVKDNVN